MSNFAGLRGVVVRANRVDENAAGVAGAPSLCPPCAASPEARKAW